MSKKWILAACLIASGQLNANELDNLVNSSNALRQQFSNGIIAVGGMINVAQDGGIPSNELLANKDAYITAEVQNAYNQAIAQMQAASFTNMGAQEFFDQQAADQMSLLDQAVDSYVAAAGALIEGATLANMAENLRIVCIMPRWQVPVRRQMLFFCITKRWTRGKIATQSTSCQCKRRMVLSLISLILDFRSPHSDGES